MALAYAQDITAADMKSLVETMNNINDKEIFYSIFDTINTEYAKMASDALASYTVTTGLQATLEAKCRRMSNAVQVEILKSFFVVLLTEFASVETNGLSYTIKTSSVAGMTSFSDLLNQSVQNYQDVENRIALNSLITLIQAEHVILAAAN
jgi:hypothetical protein